MIREISSIAPAPQLTSVAFWRGQHFMESSHINIITAYRQIFLLITGH
jgi:hypothetical protein